MPLSTISPMISQRMTPCGSLGTRPNITTPPYGEDIGAAYLKLDLVQGARWRTCQPFAGGGLEHAVVAGAVDAPLVALVEYRAEQMGAALFVGHEVATGQVDQNGGIVARRILKVEGLSFGHVTHRGDPHFGQVYRALLLDRPLERYS